MIFSSETGKRRDSMSDTMILTGAIRPSFSVLRNDPSTRLIDYLCAIRRWLDVPTLERVVYCDSSACAIPEHVFNSPKYEFLGLDDSEQAARYGAGKAEMTTVAFVLENSRFPIDEFFKCTGRIFVKNFEDLSREMEWKEGVSLFLRPWYAEGWADTRFFRIRAECFQTWITPRIPELTGYHHGGHVVESLFHEYISQAQGFSEPRMVGFGGHCNNPYEEDFSEQEKQHAEETVRKFGSQTFFCQS
jgi:hypothetical protein